MQSSSQIITTNKPTPNFLEAGCPSCHPTNSVRALKERRRRFRINTEVRCVGAHLPLSRRGLNPIKPVYDPDRPDDRLNLTASAFNQLGQYTSSPGRRGYCYAELAVFFP